MKKNWYSITNKGDAECVIDIFDEIGMWGVSAKDFAEQLRGVGKIKSLTLNLDSPGGDCNDGLTIYDAIKASGASVTVNVIGLAASMASVIMLAADAGKIRIYENARVMIHRVTGGAFGNSDDLDAATKLVKQFEDRIVSLYVARTGKDEAEIRDMMKAQLGTWFFGQEAVDAGFADSVISGVKAKAFKAQWAGLFTMLPAALFKGDEKAIDTAANCYNRANGYTHASTRCCRASRAGSHPARCPARSRCYGNLCESRSRRNHRRARTHHGNQSVGEIG